jgi:hypothetical protein
MAQTVWQMNGFPKVGIRPVIDGRRHGVRESLEEQTMNMAKTAAALISENLRYPDGSPVECVIADTTIGGVYEAEMCAKKFRECGVGVSLSVTPCWCYGTETMDADPLIPKAVWGFNGTERPGAVYLASMLAGYAQRGMPTYGIYGHEVQAADDTSVPDDVKEKILRFVKAGLAVAMVKGKSYLSVGSSSMGIAGSFLNVDFFQDYLGMRPENMDECEIERRVQEGIYDKEEYERALEWVKKYCKEGKDYNPKAIQKSRAAKDADWEYVVKMAIIVRDMMVGNPKLAEMGFGEEAVGRNAIAAGFQGQRQWTDHWPNGDFMEAFLNSTFDWNGARPLHHGYGKRHVKRRLHDAFESAHQSRGDVRRRAHLLVECSGQASHRQGAQGRGQERDNPSYQFRQLLSRRGRRHEREGQERLQKLVGRDLEGYRRHDEGDEVGSGGGGIFPRRRVQFVLPHAEGNAADHDANFVRQRPGAGDADCRRLVGGA